MSNPPERIWIEDEFGEGDDDQWIYGTWDVRNYAGYDIEYVRADIVQAQIDAERERADKAEAALRVSVGGCDANEGWSHKPISIDGGKYFFCQDCGETLTKAVAKRHSTAATIRKGDQP